MQKCFRVNFLTKWSRRDQQTLRPPLQQVTNPPCNNRVILRCRKPSLSKKIRAFFTAPKLLKRIKAPGSILQIQWFISIQRVLPRALWAPHSLTAHPAQPAQIHLKQLSPRISMTLLLPLRVKLICYTGTLYTNSLIYIFFLIIDHSFLFTVLAFFHCFSGAVWGWKRYQPIIHEIQTLKTL